MSSGDENYTGIWLHEGSRRGENFSHTQSNYDHKDQDEDGQEGTPSSGPMRMRHVVIDQEGGSVGVWVPEHWKDEEITEAVHRLDTW